MAYVTWKERKDKGIIDAVNLVRVTILSARSYSAGPPSTPILAVQEC